jgi:hypothetical protein
MNAPVIDLKQHRIENARAFAGQFTRFEWNNLCSYQWFLTLIDKGLDTGDFFEAQTRAEERLVKDKLRKPLPIYRMPWSRPYSAEGLSNY